MRRLFICLAVIAVVLAGWWAEVSAQPTAWSLAVPLRGQLESSWCWAASSEMVLFFYGTVVDQDSIAEWACWRAPWCMGPITCTDCSCWPHPCATCCDTPNVLIGAPYSVSAILSNMGAISNYSWGPMTRSEIEQDLWPYHCMPFIIQWKWAGEDDDQPGHLLVGYAYNNLTDIVGYLDPLPLGRGSCHLADYAWVDSCSEHQWTRSLRISTTGTCDARDTVVCEPQSPPFNPAHPDTYWYDVSPSGFGRCDFHVRVYDANAANYTGVSLPNGPVSSWKFKIHNVGNKWWASWWDTTASCQQAIFNTFRFQFANPTAGSWGHWTTTFGNSPNPYWQIVDMSPSHCWETDGYGYRVHVPGKPSGPGGGGSLGMHTVPSWENLNCGDLADSTSPHFPDWCTDIDNSLTLPELDESYYEMYVVLLAYNVDAIAGVEFAIGGWPDGPDAPPPPDVYYCPETSMVQGDPFDGGVRQEFGEILTSEDPFHPIVFAYFPWDAAGDPDCLPITLEYSPSSYTYPDEPRNFVIDESGTEELTVITEHGCTIGHGHWDVVPYEDCATTPVADGEMETPAGGPRLRLEATWPNPFQPRTTIEYTIDRPGHVNLAVYDATGRVVRRLVDSEQPAGRSSVVWDGRDGAGRRVGSGVYFCRLVTGGAAETRKIVLAR